MLSIIKRKFEEGTLYGKIRKSVIFFTILPVFLIFFILLPTLFVQKKIDMENNARNYLSKSFDDFVYNIDILEDAAQSITSDSVFLAEIGRILTAKNVKEYERIQFKSQTMSRLKIMTMLKDVEVARLHIESDEIREYSPYLYQMGRAQDSLWYEERERISADGQWFWDVTDNPTEKQYSGYVVADDMASYVLPFRIMTNINGVFEVMVQIDSLLPDVQEENTPPRICLLDVNKNLYGIEKEDDAGIVLTAIDKIIGLDHLQTYKTAGVELFYTWVAGRLMMVSLIRHSGNGMYLVKVESVIEQYTDVVIELLVIILCVCLFIKIMLRAISMIIRELLNDFTVIVDCVKEVADGNKEVRIPYLEQQETRMIADEYNKMLDNLERMANENMQRELIMRDVQIKALEKQIDSHFMYNVLDSIKMMAEVRGVYDVADALVALGRLTRYNLQLDSPYVKLAEEITYLKSYIRLMNIRMDYEINVYIQMDEELTRIKVPKMILQPVAENVIVHGLYGNEADTSFQLKISKNGEDVRIEMTDMGRGIEEKRLDEVRAKIYREEDEERTEGTGNIGLSNIHKRLRLIYGENYGVQIYSKEGCYTKTVLLLKETIGNE